MNFEVDNYNERNKGIGGSDAGVVMGVSPYKKPYKLWLEKTGREKPFDLSNNKKVIMGNKLEPLVASMYEEQCQTKVEIDERTHYHPEHKFMFAHIDRWLPEKNRILEIKTSSYEKMWENGVPETYKYQCMHYCAVLGVFEADVAVLINGHIFRIYKLKFTQDDIDNLIEKEKEFIHCVESDEWISEIKEEEFIEINDIEAIDICKRITALKEKQKLIEEERRLLEDELKILMEGNHLLSDENGNIIATFKEQISNRFDSKALKNDDKKLYEKYVKETITRVLRIK